MSSAGPSALATVPRPTVWNGPSSPEVPSPPRHPVSTSFAPVDDDELYGTGLTRTTSPDGTFSGAGGTFLGTHSPSTITQQAHGAGPGAQDPVSQAGGAAGPAADPGGGSALVTGHAWTVPWGGSGAAVVLTGGAFAVDTSELRTFASTLTTAADGLDDARTFADSALWEARCAVPPPEEDVTVPLAPGVTQAFTGTEAFIPSFDVVQDDAVAALTNLSVGAGSLDAVAGQLRALASDVVACADLYDQAEDGATVGTGTGAVPLGWAGPAGGGAGWSALGLLPLATGPLASFTLLALAGMGLDEVGRTTGNEVFTDARQAVLTLAGDPGTAEWVLRDLATLLFLGTWAPQASTGREAATVEVYLDRTATRLDPWVSAQLPDQVQVGSQLVDTTSLTAMERVAYFLALRSEQSGAVLYGQREGVVVTPRGGQGSTTVPPGAQDPFGLGTAVAPGLATAATRVTDPPRTVSQTIRYSEDLQHHRRPDGEDHDEEGTVSVLRTTHEDGTRSWLVVVPGTTDWGSGDHETQDLLTNLQGVAGRPTDMESAVVTAMRQAGIQPGEPVGMYGHSQGAITVANIAADPAVGEQFTITSLLTAGGPTAGADLPDSVHALHLENAGDAVPALDAAPTPATPTRVTATIDSHETGIEGYPHGSGPYAEAAEGLEAHEPALTQWSQDFRSLTGDGEDGAVTEELLFDVKRDLENDGVGLGEPGPPPEPQPEPQQPPVPVDP